MQKDMMRGRWAALVALSLGLGLGLPAAASAQTQFSLGGGWTALPSAPAPQPYSQPFNLSASVAPASSGPVHLRADLVALDYRMGNALINFAPPCPLPGCSRDPSQFQPFSGLTLGALATTQIDLLPHGRAYLLTGVGAYRLQLRGQPVSVHPGETLGAGVNIPLSTHADMFVEARWMGVNGAFAGPSWYAPLTVGFRSR